MKTDIGGNGEGVAQTEESFCGKSVLPPVCLISIHGAGVRTYGGSLRSDQLMDLLVEGGFQVERLRPPDLKVGWQSRLFRAASSFLPTPFEGRQINLKSRRALAWSKARWRELLGALPRDTVVIWEYTKGDGCLIGHLAAEYGLRCIATPQNIESFVLGDGLQWLDRDQHHGLRIEVNALGCAASIYCICHEDAIVTRNLGLPSSVLPYRPPIRSQPMFNRIRSRRIDGQDSKNRLVILGTLDYPPSERGMKEVAQELPEVDGFSCVAIGLGTEKMTELSGGQIVGLGYVSSEELENELSECTAVLAHQRDGSGALTRLIDCLAAGVPVLASIEAGRGTLGHPDVHLYEDFKDIPELIRKCRSVAEPPKSISYYEKAFLLDVAGANR